MKAKCTEFLLSELKQAAFPAILVAMLILFGAILGIVGKRIGDRTVVSGQKEDYPLDTCLLTDKNLNKTREAADYVYGNSLVRFCCADCVEIFLENPEPYMRELSEAYERSKY